MAKNRNRNKQVTFRKDNQIFRIDDCVEPIDVERYKPIMMFLNETINLHELKGSKIAYNTETQQIEFQCEFNGNENQKNTSSIIEIIDKTVKTKGMKFIPRWRFTTLYGTIEIEKKDLKIKETLINTVSTNRNVNISNSFVGKVSFCLVVIFIILGLLLIFVK